MRTPRIVSIGLIPLIPVFLSIGCSARHDAVSAHADPAGNSAAAAQAKVTRQDPITSADLNPAISQKQKDLMLIRKNK